MSDPNLQGVLDQLSKLSPEALCAVKTAVNERLAHHLRGLGVNGDLTAEEWKKLEGNDRLNCIKMVRERTGLGLFDAKDYVDRARAKGR